jgi:hypothetical protein
MAMSCSVRHLGTVVAFLGASCLAAAEPAVNVWERQEKATLTGQRWDVPVGYAPELNRFLVLGGRTSWAEYKKPRPYDDLSFDPTEGRWENRFPEGKDWGPRFGPCQAPAWKDEHWHFRDTEGNVRPNWTVYGTFSLGQKYDYDPDTRAFYFYAGGRTFRYDPAARRWTDPAPKSDPQTELGGILLWSSMCYDRHNKRFVLFGGGNVQSPRGDPGTWTYSPSDNVWTRLNPDRQPPPRANSRLVYDPVAKKVVLFGGDQLDQLLADTWTFDVVTGQWQQRQPSRSPAPRGGHALLWLPKARKVLLLGGYEYTSAVGYVERLYKPLALEAWTYDTAADRWDLIKRFEPGAGPVSSDNVFLSAAVDADDQVLVLANGTWLCRLDVSKPDAAGREKFGVASGTTTRRSGPHDPAWFREGVPPADRDKVAAELKDLPANRWVLRPTPKLPRPNMDWGSAVFAPEADLILRFSGGHSAYSGTAPQVYDVKSDRYSIPFAPEYPLEYVYGNDQVRGEWSFQGNPWMTGHTYKSTGYDPNLKCLVFAPHEYTYFFDPAAGKWSRSAQRNPYQPNFYVVTVCATPQGAVVWADRREGGAAGLWRLDADTRTWKPLPLTGALPAKSADHHGLAYDAKRERLLLFSDLAEHRGDVAEYDLKTGRSRWLEAAGREKATAPSRETVYLPEWDAVLVGARVAGGEGKMLWLLYDCAANAWFGADLAGADPIGKGVFNNSMGLMYDPNRRLVWAVGQNSHVHVLRLDRKEAQLRKLE